MSEVKQKPPVAVHLYVTPVCNLKCTHCYYEAKTADVPKGPLLSPADIADIIGTLCADYAPDIHMEGGEVFLRADLPEVFDVVDPCCWSAVTLTTSGTVRINVDYDRLRLLDCIRVSVEGHTDALQRAIRGVGLAPVLRTCDELRRNNIDVTLRVTLHRANCRDLWSMVDFFLRHGITHFSFYELQPVGRGRNLVGDLGTTEADIHDVLLQLTSQSLDPRIMSLKVSLPPPRASLVDAVVGPLGDGCFQTHRIIRTPNLTVNSDGTVGSSPWRITAHNVADRLLSYRPESFRKDLQQLFLSGALSQPCNHTSEVVVRYIRPPEAIV